MPRKTISSGNTASLGIGNNAEITGSRKLSNARTRPIRMPALTPTTEASARPAPARMKLIRIWSSSSCVTNTSL